MLRLILLIFFMITLISNNNLFAVIPTSALSTNESDHLALLAIKSRIANGPKGALSSWNESVHFCQWEGVRCGRRHKRVTFLDLSSKGLSGSLSPYVGNLSFLRVLYLYNNTFEGIIPSEIGQLFRLEQLILFNNSFEGNVPATLSNCTNLQRLWLRRNKFVGTILQQVTSLLKLKEVVIEYNNFTGEVPHSIGNLTFLEMVIASGNQFRGKIPYAIGQLENLQILQFDSNQLHGTIPTEIGRLFRLEQLTLINNFFEGNVPATLSNCTNLKRLWLSGNKLVGTILQQVTPLLKLEELFIHFNNFHGEIPSSIGNLTSLITISASSNNFRGCIPYTIGQLKKLSEMGFGENQLNGTIPPSLYNLSLLSVFYVGRNQLVGSLPSDIGLKLPKLQFYQKSENKFTGLLPVSFSNCSELALLQLVSNSFHGKIAINFGMMQNLSSLRLSNNNFGSGEPDEMNFIASLVNCTKLKALEFSSNLLRGQLPSCVGNLSTGLSSLVVGDNPTYGSIPPSMMNLVGLETLDMYSNQFTGTIPSNLGNLGTLEQLNLEENSLSGNIPESIGNLSLLNKHSLAYNRLEGRIPKTLGNCQNLIFLNLSSNNLSGSIPRELLELSSLSIVLDLSHNHLSGSIPLEIGQLHNLGYLDLSDNELAGEVPSSVGNCKMLEYLQLEENFLGGSIPSSFASLTGILYLDLSRNNFSGEIPKFLEKFQMNHLNLSFNDFEGEVPMNGIFKNATAISVDGNNRLCGGMPELHLRECSVKERKKGKKMLLVFLIVIPIISMMIGLALSSHWLLNKRRRSKTELPSLVLGQSFTKYSYGMLLKATNEFSSQNLIGVGSFSRVFKGVLQEDGEVIAVKVLNLDILGALKSFMAECEAWKNIRHRNLVKIITTCSSVDFQGNDFKALVYEFMPNGSLESWLHPVPEIQNEENEQQRLSLLQRISIATDVAHALDYLHNRCEIPIIHCDLKPSNILLDGDMVAHVGDFGLAKFLLPEDSSITQGSSIGLRGTIGYAPPEYGLGSDMSANGDVYSFGIVLLELITGKRPTDNMFQNGVNLHNYAKTGLLDSITNIVDTSIMKEEDIAHTSTYAIQKLECIALVIKVGIACSVESAQDRMNISQVVQELQRITNITLQHEISVVR